MDAMVSFAEPPAGATATRTPLAIAQMAATLVVVCTLAILWWQARAVNFFDCHMECGETVLSIRAVDQFRANGVQYGLLEHHVVPNNPGIYTHSANIGTLSFVLLDWLGVRPFEAKVLLPLAAHGVGLFYVFLTVRRFSNSDTAGLIALLLFATTYWTIGAFALNPLRAWHVLAFFAVMYHAHGFALIRASLRNAAGLFLGALVAFGCGYDFWVIVGATSLSVLLFNARNMYRRRFLGAFVVICAAFALPFLLRQGQVIYALGLAYWLQDVTYSMAIKIPFANIVINIPPLETIDAFYRAHNVLRPPASPSNSVGEIFYTFRKMVGAITVPRWGWLTLITYICVLTTGIHPRWRETYVGSMSWRLLVPMSAGIGIGLVVFSPFALHVYLKHEFPLVGFPLLTAKGVVLTWLVREVFTAQRKYAAVAVGVTLAYVGDERLVNWNNTANGLYSNLRWAQFVHQHPEADFALSTQQLLDSANPILGLTDGNFRYLSPSELRGSGARFIVYQPFERIVDFDSRVPTCSWQDWLSHLTRSRNSMPLSVSCIYGSPLPNGAIEQPSLSAFADQANGYQVVERSDVGIGYVVLERRY